MKNFLKISIICLLISSKVFAQNYICSAGETSFFSSTPMENIDALDKKVASVLNISTNEIAVKMTMTDFKFQNHLMEEHFNENYMESAKYPTGIFKGKINEKIDFTKDGSYDVTATGALTMHGVSKDRTLKGKLTIARKTITLTSNFDVPLKDHKIEIPTLVIAKIASTIAVKNKFVFVPLKK